MCDTNMAAVTFFVKLAQLSSAKKNLKKSNYFLRNDNDNEWYSP